MTAQILQFPSKPEITASPANRRKLIERARFHVAARDKIAILLTSGWTRNEEVIVTFSNPDVLNGEQLFLDDAFEIEMLRGLARMGVVI